MDDLESLLSARAGVGDPLDALLSARASPADTAPSPPVRFMAPPTFAEKHIAPLVEALMGSNPQGSPMGRVIQGAADPALGVMQLGANAVGLGEPVNKKLKDLEGSYQSQRAIDGSTGFDPLRTVGNFGAAMMAPTPSMSGGLLANVLRGAGAGAAYNSTQPVTDGGDNFWGEKGKQVATGAVFGGAGVPVASALASVLKPNTSTAARLLMDQGVNLTPGQILGGGFHRAEDAATSIPVLGDFIRDAKNRTLGDFNRAAYARALSPIGEDASKLPVGPEGVAIVKQKLGDAYDALLPKLSFDVKTIQPELTQLRQLAAGLPKQEADQFNKILDKNLGQLSNGKADGQTFKLITSNLGNQAKSFRSATDGYQQQLGDALTQAQSLFRQGLTRSNPAQAQELAAIDQGYANYARIRQAAASAGDKSSGFTPAQLAAAVRGQDKSAGKGATATGSALMQDLSDAARQVLPSQVGDSGTPLRHAIQAGIGGLVGHSMLPESMSALMVPAAGTVGGLALPYTKLGQKAMQSVLAERPEYAASLAAALRRLGPLAGAAAAPALTNGL